MSPADRAGASRTQYFDQKIPILEEIFRLAGFEYEAIETNNISELSNLIAQKKALMGQVDDLDKRAAADPPALPAQGDGRLSGLRRRAKDILTKLAEADRKNRTLLERKTGETKAELGQLRGLRQARKAYIKKDEKPGTNFLAR